MRMGMRQWGRCFIVMAMIAVVAAVGASGVSAHAQIKAADPAANAVVPVAPVQVTLTFSEETNPTKSGGSVTNASGATVSTGFKVDLNERTKMTIPLMPNLPSGVYTVKWNSFTDDDSGVANGTFTFTVQAAAATTGTATTGTAPAVASAIVGTVAASPTTAPAATTAPTAPRAATVAPTATTAPAATRAATAAVATGTGGGAATTLPATGKRAGGIGNPWMIWSALIGIGIGAMALAAGLGLRLRAARARR